MRWADECGRSRAESPAAILFPQLEPDETDDGPIPELVPLTQEDIPGDDNSIPFVEVGGARTKSQPTPNSSPRSDRRSRPAPR